MSEQTVVDITPKLDEQQLKRLNKSLEEKSHLEYLCFMMLRAMVDRANLRQLFESGAKHGIINKSIVTEFFGHMEEKGYNGGCEDAEGHSIPSLLESWNENTEEFLKSMSGRS